MSSQLNRVDIIPSQEWSAIQVAGRLVWAAAADDLIATYWYSTGDESVDGYTLIRTGALPDSHSTVGMPPGSIQPYWPTGVDMDGAYPFISSELVLWVCKVGTPAGYAIEGSTPAVTYPLNANVTPPTGE